ncbi:MAG: acyltransferase family protein [Prevotellaceae bacterium]|nr:acyltransferase family protein [Prevotellaceae bacterium]
MKQKKYLMDVAVIRITLIFFLVFYHAFCPFTGAWGPPSSGDFHPIELYKWMGLISHLFQLEAMVFISGLLFGYALMLNPKRLSFNDCVVKKAKRLLLPCLLFSVIYYVLFPNHIHEPWYIILQKLSNGIGHLWFLPMIFWCFVLCYLVEKSHLPPPVVLIASIIILSLPSVDLILGLKRVHRFFFFFYFGFAIKKEYIKFKYVESKRYLLLLLIMFLVLCVAHELLPELWKKSNLLIENGIRAIVIGIVFFLCPFSMIVFLYSLANKPKVQYCLNRCPQLMVLSSYCYGVYIYQDYILTYLYYHTDFASVVPNALFPWAGFVITLILSLLLCHLTLKTRFGRFLIG